jgi:hypothetical protein
MVERLSASERRYVHDGLLHDVRNDGRTRLDFRPISIESSLIPQVRTPPASPVCRVQCNRGVGESTPSRTITQRQAHVSRVINGAADHLAQTLKRGRVTGEWLGSVEAGRHGRAGGGQGALPAASTLGAGRQGCVLSGGAVSSLTGLTCLRLSS